MIEADRRAVINCSSELLLADRGTGYSNRFVPNRKPIFFYDSGSSTFREYMFGFGSAPAKIPVQHPDFHIASNNTQLSCCAIN